MSKRFGTGYISPAATSIENSFIATSCFRPESHVAQQSRRDKLRVQQLPVLSSPAVAAVHHHVDLPRGPDPDPNLIQVRDVRSCDSLYDPAVFSTGATMMLDFSSTAHVPSNEVSFSSLLKNPTFCSSNISFSSSAPAADARVGEIPSLWRGSHPTSCDWIMNYATGGGNAAPIQSPIFASQLYLKPDYSSGYQDVQPAAVKNSYSSSELSSQDNHRHHGELPFGSQQFHHNTLQEVVTSSSFTVGNHQGLEMTSLVQNNNIRETGQPGSWADGGSELVLLPSYGNQPGSNPMAWVNRQSQQWNGEDDYVRIKGLGNFGPVTGGNATQGLALSLSSNPPPELHVAQFEERFGGVEDLPSRAGIVQDLQNLNSNVFSYSKPNKCYGNSVQGLVGSPVDARRSVGPLGPFTGYAIILKNSKFLKPAQQLLDEICSVVMDPKLARPCETSKRISADVSVTCSTVAENEVSARMGDSGVSSASLYSSTEASGEGCVGTGTGQVHHPEFQQKKAKLLYMQEEVCRRYKQYHQQMQMVVSSFESVAGLSAATPYTSSALKTVSQHFRCLKNAISEQLRHVSKVLGGEFMSSAGSSKGETMTMPRLKLIDQTFHKQEAGENGVGFLDHNQPIWRPQRGLPERSVAVLRAWLFEHFLHPYPTDTDKHMLASQTGLSRNQVSNWFINARVRLWKPMVEEIHMLETQGLTEMDLNSSKNVGKPGPGSGERPALDNRSDHQSGKSPDCSSTVPTSDDQDHLYHEQWHREKRSRMEHCPIPASTDGGLIGFSPYHQSGIDIGGLGAVSLTLGLRHNEGAVRHPEQQQMRPAGLW